MNLYGSWPNEPECLQLQKALGDAEIEMVRLVFAESPWLQVDVWVHLEGERKLALWRATGAVYKVGSDGAVGDDPIVAEAWHV